MGVSLSTLGGWGVISILFGYYFFRSWNENKLREAAKAANQRQRLEDRQNSQSRKDNKEKAKRQRGDAYSKDVAETGETAKAKPRAAKPAPVVQNIPVTYSSDDGVDNREFARQLASVKQGTSLNGPKKSDEKKQKSVKQSRAREMDKPEERQLISAPSSTAGVDADDDESPIASPEVQAKDAGDVADMLEPKAAGPSVLRLTDTDKVKNRAKKAPKESEPAETKKQRQNRRKAEAEKAAREQAEAERKVALENQRRLARISEGRAAKDGSAFTASQKQLSVWTANGINGNKAQDNDASNDGFLPVQPLDTGDSSIHTDASVESAPSVPSKGKAGSWMSSLPSEEEQMELLRKEEQWSTVTTKKATRKNKQPAAEAKEVVESAVAEPQQMTTVASAPVVTKAQKPITNGKPAKTFGQKSSFAALSSNEPEGELEVEEEWDV